MDNVEVSTSSVGETLSSPPGLAWRCVRGRSCDEVPCLTSEITS